MEWELVPAAAGCLSMVCVLLADDEAARAALNAGRRCSLALSIRTYRPAGEVLLFWWPTPAQLSEMAGDGRRWRKPKSP